MWFQPLGPESPMESFLVSLSTVAIAEMGDRTQLLSLMLAAHYRKPWPILAGVLCATLANHILAALVGVRLGRFLTPTMLDAAVGISMIGMALSILVPVVLGTTAGMLLDNAPVVFLGKAFSDRLPLTAMHRVASALFLILGAVFIYRAVQHAP